MYLTHIVKHIYKDAGFTKPSVCAITCTVYTHYIPRTHGVLDSYTCNFSSLGNKLIRYSAIVTSLVFRHLLS